MAQYFTKWSLLQFIITIILAILLMKGADYLLKSGNGDTLVIASGVLIAVGYSDIIGLLLDRRKKNMSENGPVKQQKKS